MAGEMYCLFSFPFLSFFSPLKSGGGGEIPDSSFFYPPFFGRAPLMAWEGSAQFSFPDFFFHFFPVFSWKQEFFSSHLNVLIRQVVGAAKEKEKEDAITILFVKRPI